MKRHRAPPPSWCVGALTLIVWLILGACGSATQPASSIAPVPTSSIGTAASTIDEALGIAREVFTASPPYIVHQIDSLVYVETSVGRARELLDPDRRAPQDRWFAQAREDAAVWVVVAYGTFQWKSVPGDTTPRQPDSSVGVVIANGEVGTFQFGGNGQYDLSQLGAPVEIKVPLPPFPTPIVAGVQ